MFLLQKRGTSGAKIGIEQISVGSFGDPQTIRGIEMIK